MVQSSVEADNIDLSWIWNLSEAHYSLLIFIKPLNTWEVSILKGYVAPHIFLIYSAKYLETPYIMIQADLCLIMPKIMPMTSYGTISIAESARLIERVKSISVTCLILITEYAAIGSHTLDAETLAIFDIALNICPPAHIAEAVTAVHDSFCWSGLANEANLADQTTCQLLHVMFCLRECCLCAR